MMLYAKMTKPMFICSSSHDVSVEYIKGPYVMDKNAIYVVLFKMFVVLWQIVWVHHEEVFRTSKFELHVLLHGVLEHLVFHGCRP